MSPTNKEITIPESVFKECYNIYSDVLTYSKQKMLRKLIQHAYIAGTQHSEVEEEN
ncbi:hypothetical protein [uncultured Treponema sp.]|uniref:hypothetical protein n=1 Tax=uncultured Treponema sp. TaxID=162155 RepID=UPI0025D11DE3|nr:hypothetical protein [uncultured Treponema sp.]